VLLDRGQRFTHSISETAGNLAQRAEYVLLLCCLRLFLVKDLASAAAFGLKRDYVLASERCDRAFEDGGASSPFADSSSEFGSEPRIRPLTH
jgi:hypothetical protein